MTSKSSTKETRERDRDDDDGERLKASAKSDKLSKLAERLGIYSSAELSTSGWARVLITGAPKAGKAQPNSEPILTPTGWREMGSLCVGDAVIGSDGKPCTVLGVFPQGMKEILRVAVDDGAYTRCCADHLWLTTSRSIDRLRWRRQHGCAPMPLPIGTYGVGTVRTLAQIGASLHDRHYLPTLTGPVQFAEQNSELPIDPYVLGLLLGDGSLGSGGTTSFCKNDYEVHFALQRYLDSVGDTWAEAFYDGRALVTRIHVGYVTSVLADLGLKGKLSYEKFIPQPYLTASPQDRLSLLRGLCDTDGAVDMRKGTSCEYSSSSPVMAMQVVELAQQLGARVSWKVRETACRDSYRILISFADGTCPFTLPRKANPWRSERRPLYRSIVSVEPDGREECTCIQVSAKDGLYVTRGCIVTHNTARTLLTAPRPIFVLNCDMPGAQIAAQRLGAKFDALDVVNIQTWIDGTKFVCAAVRAEKYQTVVVDTLSMLINNILLLELRDQASDNSYEAWRLLQTIALTQLNKLSQIDAHLFLIAHYDIDDGKLQVSGGLKSIIPALINDMAHLECRPGKDPERIFKIGAQEGYKGGGRNVKKSAVIEADIELLLEELGIQP